MIETTIQARLTEQIETSITGIFPAQGEINQPIPFLIYTLTGLEQTTYLSGQSDITKHTFAVDGFAKDYTELATLMNEVRSALSGWRDLESGIQYCRITGNSNDKQEKYHHGNQTYELWEKV